MANSGEKIWFSWRISCQVFDGASHYRLQNPRSSSFYRRFIYYNTYPNSSLSTAHLFICNSYRVWYEIWRRFNTWIFRARRSTIWIRLHSVLCAKYLTEHASRRVFVLITPYNFRLSVPTRRVTSLRSVFSNYWNAPPVALWWSKRVRPVCT